MTKEVKIIIYSKQKVCFHFWICCQLEKNCYRDDINELYQEKEQFCFCYKIQTCISWCCDLLYKNNILEIIIIDIFLELLTIGFGKMISTNLTENLNSNLFDKNFIIINICIIFYLIIAILINVLKNMLEKTKEIIHNAYMNWQELLFGIFL